MINKDESVIYPNVLRLIQKKIVLNWIFAIHWDLFHPFRLAYWFDMLQNLIRIFSNQG
jgi:hypothetical protein